MWLLHVFLQLTIKQHEKKVSSTEDVSCDKYM